LGQTKIKAILFDLGETLVNFGKVDSIRLFKEAGKRSYQFLRKLNQPVGGFRGYFWRNLWGLRVRYYISIMTGRDFDSLAVLEKYGTRRGFHLSVEQWQELNWLWYEPLRQRSWVEPGVAEALGKLTEAGLKLGIVSNTFVSGSTLDRHLAEEGLIGFFNTRVYSCQFGLRNKDVKGALRAGMRPVLKNAYTNAGKKPSAGVERIDSISELPDLVGKINGD